MVRLPVGVRVPTPAHIIPVPLRTRPPADFSAGELIVKRSDPIKATLAHVRQGPYGGCVRRLDQGPPSVRPDRLFMIPPM